jgi:hypothetical protein
MTYPMMSYIPLKFAYLCPNCNCVGNCAAQCPACASAALMSLASVLDRDEGLESARGLAYAFPIPAVAAGCAADGELAGMVA